MTRYTLRQLQKKRKEERRAQIISMVGGRAFRAYDRRSVVLRKIMTTKDKEIKKWKIVSIIAMTIAPLAIAKT